MKPNWTTEDVLCEPTPEPIASLDALVERALPTLTARLWGSCCWADSTTHHWQVGDFRFLVVEFRPSEEACLYVQFWSEPMEPVLMEVSSGHWNPGALKHVWHEQRRALEDLGFTIGGKARNFQKSLSIDSPEAAEQIARETLAIVFDLFQYRGGSELTTKMHYGRRAEEALVYTALTPEDFVKITAGAGFRAALVEEEKRFPLATIGRRGFSGTAALGLRIPGTSQFRSVLLNLVSDGRLAGTTELVLEGGVTRRWIEKRLNGWLRACREQLANKRKRAHAGRPTSQQNRLVVH